MSRKILLKEIKYITLSVIMHHQDEVVCFEDLGQLPQVVCQVHLRALC